MTKIGAIIEARLTSSRLPKKHLLEIHGEPIIGHLLKRLDSSKLIDIIIVAMTDRVEDDPLHQYVKSKGFYTFRGSENDVMGRVLDAAEYYEVDTICEVTGDCPIVDVCLIDQAIKTFNYNDHCSYLNNGRYGLPDGMNCQIFSTSTLRSSWEATNDPSDLEHVTLHIKRNPQLFPAIYLACKEEDYHPGLRLTLDYLEDFKLLKIIIEHFIEESNELFSCSEVIKFLKQNSDLVSINIDVHKR